MTSRRLFLLGAASLIISTATTEPLWNPPHLYGDGKHDDTEALEWMVLEQSPRGIVRIPPGTYKVRRNPWRDLGVPDIVIQGAL